MRSRPSTQSDNSAVNKRSSVGALVPGIKVRKAADLMQEFD